MDFKLKVILIGVLPWLLAIAVILYLTAPTISSAFDNMGELVLKRQELADLEAEISYQKNTKKLIKSINKLERELKGFNLEYPVYDNIEVFVVDLQSAVNNMNIVVTNVSVSKEKVVKLPKNFFADAVKDDREAEKVAKSSSSSKKKRKKKDSDNNIPATAQYRTIKIDGISNFENIVNLLYYLENYYRYFALKNISIKKATQADFLAPDQLEFTVLFDLYKYQAHEPKKDDKKKKK